MRMLLTPPPRAQHHPHQHLATTKTTTSITCCFFFFFFFFALLGFITHHHPPSPTIATNHARCCSRRLLTAHFDGAAEPVWLVGTAYPRLAPPSFPWMVRSPEFWCGARAWKSAPDCEPASRRRDFRSMIDGVSA